MVIPEKQSTRFGNYLEDCWPCASGLPGVNAIDTQLLRDLINSGLILWRLAVKINGPHRGNWEEFRE